MRICKLEKESLGTRSSTMSAKWSTTTLDPTTNQGLETFMVATDTNGNEGRPLIEMFILDVLRHDIEDVFSIVKMLNNTGSIGWRKFWPHDFTVKEVVTAVNALIRDGLVCQLVYDTECASAVSADSAIEIITGSEEVWHELTEIGRQIWEQWEPPIDEAD